MRRYVLLFVCLATKPAFSRTSTEGENCVLPSNATGKCRKITDCPSAVSNLYDDGISPRICDFDDLTPFICCDEDERINQEFGVKNRIAEKGGKFRVYGGVAQEKCAEYSNKILKKFGGKDDECFGLYTSQTQETTGGYKVLKMEFPHMVQLGHRTPRTVNWGCSGTLISDEYILTAAHCLKNAFGRNVTLAKLGSGNSTTQILTKVAEMIPHPKYNSVLRVNDIALLRLETPLKEFNFYVRPACVLHQDDLVQGISTKWNDQNTLKHTVLNVFGHAECSEYYKNQKAKLSTKIDERSQFCAGGPDFENNRCIPESGGPLQMFLHEPFCMYNVFGLSSFGPRCGRAPGVYTRISNYASWIESIVWP